MESAGQISTVKFCVIAAMVAAAVAVLINLQSADIFNILLAAAFGVAVYFAVYAKLTVDASAAATGAAVLAALAGILFIFALMQRSPEFIVINLIAAGSLGYAFVQLNKLRKSGVAPRDPGAGSS